MLRSTLLISLPVSLSHPNPSWHVTMTPVSMVRFLFGGIRALLRYMAPWLQRFEGYELDDRVALNMKMTDC